MSASLVKIAEGLNPAPLLEALSESAWLWTEITDRQRVPGTPHGDTETIFLRWCESKRIESVFSDIPAIDYPALDLLPEARPLIGEVLRLTHSSELGRVLLVNLKPGGRITPHIDEGAYADHYERFHLALHSPIGSAFFVDEAPGRGTYTHMRDGELWYFNHKKRHWAENQSLEPRVHLIVDCVASRFRQERE